MLILSAVGFAIQDQLGDPLRQLVGEAVSEAERERLREDLGLNDPFLVRYGSFLLGAVQGDLDDSYFFKRPALDVIIDKFPATFELVLVTGLIVLGLSIPAGVLLRDPAQRLSRTGDYGAEHPRRVDPRLRHWGVADHRFRRAAEDRRLFSAEATW